MLGVQCVIRFTYHTVSLRAKTLIQKHIRYQMALTALALDLSMLKNMSVNRPLQAAGTAGPISNLHRPGLHINQSPHHLHNMHNPLRTMREIHHTNTKRCPINVKTYLSVNPTLAFITILHKA
jgi:hypothetical protein